MLYPLLFLTILNFTTVFFLIGSNHFNFYTYTTTLYNKFIVYYSELPIHIKTCNKKWKPWVGNSGLMDRCTPAPDSFPFQLSVTPSPPQPLTLSSLLHTFYFLTTALFSSASTPFLVRLFNLFTCINTVQTTVIKRCFSLYIFKLLLFYSSHEWTYVCFYFTRSLVLVDFLFLIPNTQNYINNLKQLVSLGLKTSMYTGRKNVCLLWKCCFV